ncbi:MAG: CHAP domain-containing protein [Intestinimonas sp.]|jgi:hypothetical protein|nr:CHAP domain-containing protein [Intestinimonas sp.]
MPTANEILAWARSYLGMKESPANSNNVPFNTRYYGHAVSGSSYPWCCAFQWCLFQDIGAPELFYGGGKTASCTTLYHFYKKHGQTVEPSRVKPGDLVFFNFDGNASVMNHIGICESAGGGSVTTIDGNTGTSSEANGGEVMRRKRALKYVGGAARPAYYQKEEEEIVTQEQFDSMMDNYLAHRAQMAPGDWSAAERAKVEAAGIIQGGAGTGYKSFVTREELAVVEARALKL